MKLIEYEFEFAKFCGNSINDQNNFYNKTISLATFGQNRKLRSKSWNLFIDNKFQNNLDNYQMPLDWEFAVEPMREIFVLNNQPRKFSLLNQSQSGIVQNFLYRYRFFVYLSGIDEIPLEYQIYNNYSISFTLFDQTIKYKLNLQNGFESIRGFSLCLNQIKTFYFYATGKEEIKNFLINEQVEFLIILILLLKKYIFYFKGTGNYTLAGKKNYWQSFF